MEMKLRVLVENNTLIDRYFRGEPGVSYYLEADGKKILFDTGYSDLFIENAKKMDLNLHDLDYLVLSHSHLDHSWGLQHLIQLYTEAQLEAKEYKKPKLVTHPETFASRRIGRIDQIGSLISKERAARHFNLNLSREHFKLTENLVFLGQIERENDFEAQKPIGKVIKNGREEADYIIEDSALAYKTPQGLVIITGCSHAGICNIIEQAKSIFKEDRIVDVIGGFHLQNPSQKQLKGTKSYFQKIKPEAVHASHCTDLQSKIELAQVVNLKEVGVGLELNYYPI
jgi:7,8-dihydropterin-6-yl-methyl-4-(beta-D-ribofuranosyl)aminobenzene 5'-phosphate synthase